MKSQREVIGELNCHVVDMLPDQVQPKLVVVLCHGYGAPGTDLVPLGAEILAAIPQLANHVQFIFPEAPLSLDHLGFYGGRAWFHFRVDGLSAKILRGELRDLTDEVPADLPDSRNKLIETIRAASEQTGVPLTRFALGGFSQGAILALDVALRLEETVASVFAWSGTIVAEQEWLELAKQHPTLAIQQSHGESDLVLPYQAAEWLRDALTGAGLKVQFLRFDGGHTIPAEALQRFGGRLVELTSS